MTKIGRPKAERRIHVTTKMFSKDKERVLAQAESKGMTLAAYVRKVVLDAVEKDEKKSKE